MSEPVYVVVETLAVHDADGYRDYQSRARQQLLDRGGEVVARGDGHFDGSPPFGPVVIQKWPSRSAFVEWQQSEEYRPLKEGRSGHVDLRLTVLDAI